MNVLKDAMSSVNRRETGSGLPEKVAYILQQLHAARNIDEDARADIISIMDDCIELAGAMVNHTYPVELILRRTTNILATAQRILMHTESFRPGRLAFGAMLPDGQLLDFVASTQEEALTQLQRLQSFGVPRTALVVPVRVSSQYVMQPQMQPPMRAIEGGAGQPIPQETAQHFQVPIPPATPPRVFQGPVSPADHERAATIKQEIDAIANAQQDRADNHLGTEKGPGLASTLSSGKGE